MFGFTKNKNKSDKRQNRKKKSKELRASCVQGCEEGRTERECARQRLREEALANARQARAAIGEDTVQKMAEIIARKGNNPFDKALKSIENTDADRVADEILYMLDEK